MHTKSLLAILLFTASVSFAQTPTAALSGVARDEQGGVITRATVSVRNSDTGKARSATTDDEGRYGFINLEPGGYELRVEASGYKTSIRSGLILSVGGPAAPPAAITFLTTGLAPAAGNSTLNDTLDGDLRTPYSEQYSSPLNPFSGG